MYPMTQIHAVKMKTQKQMIKLLDQKIELLLVL